MHSREIELKGKGSKHALRAFPQSIMFLQTKQKVINFGKVEIVASFHGLIGRVMLKWNQVVASFISQKNELLA